MLQLKLDTENKYISIEQCLQIDQLGDNWNNITQNDLKNFSATYNLKIGTWGQQRLEITANLLFMLDTGPPIQIYRYFIIFFWFILLKNVNVDSVSRSSLNQSTKGWKKMLCLANIAEKHLKMLIQGRVLPLSRPILIFLSSDSESLRKKTWNMSPQIQTKH